MSAVAKRPLADDEDAIDDRLAALEAQVAAQNELLRCVSEAVTGFAQVMPTVVKGVTDELRRANKHLKCVRAFTLSTDETALDLYEAVERATAALGGAPPPLRRSSDDGADRGAQ